MSDTSRRAFTLDALRLGGLLGLVACGVASVDSDDPDDTSGDDTSGDPDTGAADGWATGGTAAMSGDYADPFGAVGTCALTCEKTLGPCYAETIERQDISEGVNGLPTRLALRVLDEDCNPVANAVVDVWHCAPSGLYSGSDAADMCTDGDSAARASRWFRGTQTTDANGRVDFDTCFPGWYSSRAVHIHFQVRKGTTAWVTSQLAFPEDVIADVFANEPVYKTYGQPDTSYARDNVFGGSAIEDYTLATARMADGAMQAYKDIVLRNSLSEGTC